MKSKITPNEVSLNDKLRILFYLENRKKEKENSSEIDSCPICSDDVINVCENTNYVYI